MLLCLNHAPGNVQGVISVIIFTVQLHHALVYLYNILVFFRSPAQHIEHVRSAITFLRDAGMTLKLRKCRFFSARIYYPGHIN